MSPRKGGLLGCQLSQEETESLYWRPGQGCLQATWSYMQGMSSEESELWSCGWNQMSELPALQGLPSLSARLLSSRNFSPWPRP